MTFTPTSIDNTPAVCFCCGREATGIGLGAASRGQADPRWLCEDCIAAGGLIRTARTKDLTPYERAAVARAVDAVGGFLESHGTDLSDWTSEQAEAFVGAIWQACGDSLREVIKEGAGPW
jgi:hypothetical protein